jgi:hypothetical protein
MVIGDEILLPIGKNNEVNFMDKYLQDALNRAKTLLKAAGILLKKQENSYYILNLLAETVYYDEAECDGACLLDDIRYWFDEFTTESIDEES